MNLINKTFANITDKLRGSSLKAKAARGSLVLAIGTFVERGMRLVRNMILARLLAPEDFGLMAIVLAVLVILESLTDTGLRQSVIQHNEGSNSGYLNAVWWLQVIRGFVIYLIAFVASPLICQLYGNPQLLKLLQVSFLSVVINGLSSPRLPVLDKEFQLAKAVYIEKGARIIGTIFTISLAVYMQSIWILVIGQLSQSVVYCILSHVCCPFRPTFDIDHKYLKDLLEFAKGMIGVSVLGILSSQMDIFILGKLVTSQQVGMYALALALARQPIGILGQISARVLFPAFAKKQEDKQALRRTIGKMIKFTIGLGIPLSTLAAFYGKPILSAIYGPQYAVVAIPFGVLCFAMVFSIQKNVIGFMYIAIGKPHIHRKYAIILCVILGTSLYPAVKLFGLVGSATTLLIANTAIVCLQVIGLRRQIGLRVRDLFFFG